MRVLHVFNSNTVGGPEKAVIPFLAELAGRKEITSINIVVLGESRIQSHSYEEIVKFCKVYRIPVIVIPLIARFDYQGIKKLRKKIKSLKFNVIHAHDVKATVYSIISTFGFKLKIVSTFHGFARTSTRDKFYEWIYFLFARSVDRIVSLNPFEKQKIEKRFRFKNVDLIPNALSNSFTQSKSEDLAKRQNQSSGPHFIYPGRFSPEKNHQIIIDAVEKIRNDNPTFHIHLFGEGSLKRSIQEQIRKKELESFISVHDYLSNIERYYHYFDCLLLPSFTEGLSMVLLEAVKQRMPILMSDIPANQFVFLKTSSNSFSPFDYAELAEALKAFTTNEIDISGINYGEIEQRFSSRVWVNSHIKSYLKAFET